MNYQLIMNFFPDPGCFYEITKDSPWTEKKIRAGNLDNGISFPFDDLFSAECELAKQYFPQLRLAGSFSLRALHVVFLKKGTQNEYHSNVSWFLTADETTLSAPNFYLDMKVTIPQSTTHHRIPIIRMPLSRMFLTVLILIPAQYAYNYT